MTTHRTSRPQPRIKPIFNPFSNRQNGQYTRKAQIIALLLILSSAAVWFFTPFSSILTRVILLEIPIKEDVILGQKSWRQMRSQYPVITHRYQNNNYNHQQNYDVAEIGRELLNAAPNFCLKHALDANQCQQQLKEYRWSFEIVSSPQEVNAFALPGGVIRITNGLLQQIRPTRGELAALIGHEIGHVLHRHSQSRLLQRNLIDIILKALVYEDEDGYDESFGEAAGEILTLLNGARFLGEMKFSRRDEYEADDVAFDLLGDGGIYHPRSVKSLLEKLWSLNGRRNEDRFASWDKTHPGTEDRIKAVEKRWNDMPRHEKRKFNGLQR